MKILNIPNQNAVRYENLQNDLKLARILKSRWGGFGWLFIKLDRLNELLEGVRGGLSVEWQTTGLDNPHRRCRIFLGVWGLDASPLSLFFN